VSAIKNKDCKKYDFENGTSKKCTTKKFKRTHFCNGFCNNIGINGTVKQPDDK
jgi:hypothetical protein